MSDVVAQLPEILERASASPLGILALMIVALSLLGFFFFREASERTRLATFALMFIGVAVFGFAVVGDSGSSDAESTREGVQPSSTVPSIEASRPPAALETTPPAEAAPAPPLPVTLNFRVGKGAGGAPLNTGADSECGRSVDDHRPGADLVRHSPDRKERTAWLARCGIAIGPRRPANFPLPGAPPYSLIAGYDNARWLLVGDSTRTRYGGPTAALWLSINDADQGRGEGFFDVQVRLQRGPDYAGVDRAASPSRASY